AHTLTYTIRDTFAVPRTATATISIVVAGVNDPPVAANDSAQVPRNGSVAIPVLGNDQDVDSVLNVSSVLVKSGPSNGNAVPLADGRIQYTPATGFFGTDVFKYTVADAQGAVSNEATVTVRVNAPPTAVNDTVQTFRDVPININVLQNDTDPDGTLVPGTVTIIVRPTRGTATPQTNGTVKYTPGFGFIGTDSFTYTVKDNDGATSNEASVTVGVIVDPFPWRNPRNPLDVNDDGSVTPIDALLIINSLNFDGARPLPNPPIPPLVPPPYYDTSGDNRIDPIDALLVINYLNSGQGGEGESAGDSASVAFGELLAAPFATSGRVTSAVLPSDDKVASDSARSVSTSNGDPLVGDPAGGWLNAWDGYAPASSLDDALDQIADDITAAQDDDVLEDLAVSELLFGRRGRG
ncbi:MAG: tandem-95 repeat protein, partial [Planctomycetes bacterium]|nr:tandem-95 repeat protein [Planctomycetota bacterium]